MFVCLFVCLFATTEIVGKSITEASKLTGEMWREMTDADKEPYVSLATEDKKRATREVNCYCLLVLFSTYSIKLYPSFCV